MVITKFPNIVVELIAVQISKLRQYPFSVFFPSTARSPP
jgi:hypothetical protein